LDKKEHGGTIGTGLTDLKYMYLKNIIKHFGLATGQELANYKILFEKSEKNLPPLWGIGDIVENRVKPKENVYFVLCHTFWQFHISVYSFGRLNHYPAKTCKS
jgi:hypothetical protein